MKLIFYLPVNTNKIKFVTFLVFVCTTASFLISHKFRLPKTSSNETPSWLQPQNSTVNRIFRVTGANQNARKLLVTDLVNTIIPSMGKFIYGTCVITL